MDHHTVLCCRVDRASAESDGTVALALARCGTRPVHFVGPRPAKDIDPLLAGRVVVIGDDADLAAVVLRLVRLERLPDVIVGYATDRPTQVTQLWSLPVGALAVDVALAGDPDLVPVVRDDVGGVLVGLGRLAPVRGTVYLDETRLLSGGAAQLLVQPDTDRGLAVTVVPHRILGFRRGGQTHRGRALQIGTTPTRVIVDGRVHDRPMERWTFYKHTQPLRLARGLL